MVSQETELDKFNIQEKKESITQIIDRKLSSDLVCLLIPMPLIHWLLPSVSVTEILIDSPKSINNEELESKGIIGEINWRDLSLPTLAIDKMLMNSNMTVKPPYRVGIFKANLNQKPVDVFAIKFGGTPKLIRVAEQDIDIVEDVGIEIDQSGLTQYGILIEINGLTTFMPNLDKLADYVFGR